MVRFEWTHFYSKPDTQLKKHEKPITMVEVDIVKHYLHLTVRFSQA